MYLQFTFSAQGFLIQFVKKVTNIIQMLLQDYVNGSKSIYMRRFLKKSISGIFYWFWAQPVYVKKCHLVYLSDQVQLITVLFLICDSYMSWSTKFVSLKLYLGFFILDSVLFLLKFIFLFNNSLTLKRHNSFQN